MDKIKHNFIQVNGLKIHVAEIGSGTDRVVLFLHGFPEIWYSWRYQMVAVANAGFRAIAPDYRGYGLSDLPPEPEKATFFDLFSDLPALLDALSISRVYVVAKDFSVRIAHLFAILHPKRLAGIITFGIPVVPLNRPRLAEPLPGGVYTSRWMEPGRLEADFARFDVKTVLRKIYILFSKTEIPTAADDQEVLDLVDSSAPLPSWFTEEDLQNYTALYEKSGFRTAAQVPYRSLNEKLPVTNQEVDAPALFIMCGKDFSLKFPGIGDYVRSGQAKNIVPNMETAHLPEGSHFAEEQFPEETNQLIINFLKRHA
ncbi:PREDICTED: bifunctional epoxide hydrolase 2-like [Ipomoea nil]|uniref:bifunctional epoxide hydrolase 2-like n=1 Tax=Ipomoea nil TaxID=35883 RepID=UPI000900B31C|nr:PREDICTED: bifunctional epoxide hydrolase 2-like [Ipomoea nil]